jgi:CDP-diacylglycerol--glycerol-3-phosphate 3-phosphatidyltransferase
MGEHGERAAVHGRRPYGSAVTAAGDWSEWSRTHGGYDPGASVVVRGWLRVADVLAAPLIRRRVPPGAVTGAGVATGLAAAVLPAPFAAAAVVASAVVDGLDGVVARRTGRVSDRGARLDRAADRLSDLAFCAGLARAGASPVVAGLAAAAVLGFEGVRTAARAGGRDDIGAVTVAERPMRVGVTAAALALRRPGLGAAALAVQCAAGAAHLRSVRRRECSPA